MTYTRQQWSTDVLRALGNANPSPELVSWFVGWTDYETAPGQTAAYNLLNTTLPEPGATNYNAVGVKNYTSYSQGVQATADTLRGGYYPTLLADLQSNNLSDLTGNPGVSQQIGTWGTHKTGAQIQAVAGQGAADSYGGTAMPINSPAASQGQQPPMNWWDCLVNPAACIGQQANQAGQAITSPIASVNWADVGIRGGLILLGGLLVLVVVAKMLSKPAVEVEEQ